MTQTLFSPDFRQNQLRNAVAHTVSAPPGDAKNGQWWYDSVADTWGVKLARGFINILDRTTHTGQIATTDISNFAAAVALFRLDQFAKPTADLDINGRKLLGLPAPASANEPARLIDLQNAQLGYDWKDSAELATTANIALTGTITVDGVTSGNAKRILVRAQTVASQNGLYLSNATGAWVRTNDGGSGQLTSGAVVSITDGTTQKGFAYRLTTADPITIGTTALTWSDFARPFVPVEGLGIKVTNGSTIGIDVAVVSRHVTGTIGDGVSTVITWAHGLNNQWAVPYTCLASTGEKCDVDIDNTDANTYTIRTTLPLPVGAVKISAHG